MRNIDVRIHVKLELHEIGCWFNINACGFNEQLRYYFESANQHFFKSTTEKLIYAKKLEPRKKF